MIKKIIILIFISSCGRPVTNSPDNRQDYPLKNTISEEILLEKNMFLNFDFLPLKGEVRDQKKFWSGDSWPLNKGAINRRWNTPTKRGFGYASPSEREIFTMPESLLKELSPSEKYDLFMGNYDYPMKSEVDRIARSGSLNWEGLCHGWASASIHHQEPAPGIFKNPDGIDIYFGSSDIKAILTWAYSKVILPEGDILGRRCEDEEIGHDDACDDDLSAVHFHVVLANKLGLRGESVIADIERFKEVWNHPVTKYESVIEKMKTHSGDKEVTLVTKLTYVDVTEKNSWEKYPSQWGELTIRYQLTMDRHGNIFKGQWLSKERPDFIWVVPKIEKFEGYLSGINFLIK